jgi:hypothetical protein
MKRIKNQQVTNVKPVNKSVNPFFKLWITCSCSQILTSLAKASTEYPHETYYIFCQFFVAGAMANMLGLPASLKVEKPQFIEDRVWNGFRLAYLEGHRTMSSYDLSEVHFWIRNDIISRASSFYWVCVYKEKLNFPVKSDMNFYRPFFDLAV